MKKFYAKYLFFKKLVFARLTHKAIPVYLYWSLTENCNLQCSYCYGLFGKQSYQNLSACEAIRLIDEFDRIGVKRITILGGEPLLYNEIDAVVDALCKRNISCSILTNATLAVEHIDILKKVDEVGLSLDGSPPVHDRIRGEGNFDDIIRTIKALKSIGKKIVVTYTLFSENIQELEFVLEFVKKQNVLLTVNIAHSRIDSIKNIPVSKADNESLRSALAKVITYKKMGYPILRTYKTLYQMLAWQDFYIDGTKEKPCADFPVCMFGKFAACVAPDGVMYPCFLGTDKSTGKNILEVGIEEAWGNCQKIDHCYYCHVPCFIEYNALLNLKVYMIMSIISKLVLKCKR